MTSPLRCSRRLRRSSASRSFFTDMGGPLSTGTQTQTQRLRDRDLDSAASSPPHYQNTHTHTHRSVRSSSSTLWTEATSVTMTAVKSKVGDQPEVLMVLTAIEQTHARFWVLTPSSGWSTFCHSFLTLTVFFRY